MKIILCLLSLTITLLYGCGSETPSEKSSYDICVENKIEEGMAVLIKNAAVSFSNREVLRRGAIKECFHLNP